MVIRQEDREDIKNNNIKYSTSLTYDGVLKTVNNDPEEAIKEIVRITHAQRITEFINYDFGGKKISDNLILHDKYPYAHDVISICVAHGENYDYLKNLRQDRTKGSYHYNLQFLAAILRIADYLDLDKQRTPILWYKIMRIDGFSKEEWEKHFIIHNENKLKEYIDNKLQIFFDGESSNAKIHRKYLSYIDDLKNELENADELLNTRTTEEKYAFKLSTKIEDNVSTKGFKYSDLRLNLNYSAITELLMGKNIYGDSRLGLREIIQNSIDACELMKEVSFKEKDVLADPQIFITFSKKENYVRIKDTGIGMTLDIVKKHFLNIGKSYYKSNEYIYENYKYKPIGQYGIGFLACFLLSDNVTVKTRHYKTNEISQIELEKNSEYVVTNTEVTGTFIGTEIKLDYDKFFSVFEDKTTLIAFIEKYFFTSIPIKIRDDDTNENYINIANCCSKLIENKRLKETGNKYETIKCQTYSPQIDGVLEVCNKKRSKNFSITHLKDNINSYFYFNNETQKFIPLADKNQLERDYYFVVEYADIKEEEYEKIRKTRKQNKNKRTEILCLTTKSYLIIHSDNELGYRESNDSQYSFTLNNIDIKEIIHNSGFNYYEELLDEFEYYESIFLYKDNYVNLQPCTFDSCYYYRDSDSDKLDFYFYNKGVWIQYFRYMYCQLPYALKVLGFVNYHGDGVKLDVSRNAIIGGQKRIRNEFANIILSFMKDNSTDPEWSEMLEHMIVHNKNKYIDAIQE